MKFALSTVTDALFHVTLWCDRDRSQWS